MKRTIVLMVTATALLLTACGTATSDGTRPWWEASVSPATTTTPTTSTATTPPTTPGVVPVVVPRALVAFDACDDFLSYEQAEALERVGPWGLEGYGGTAPVLFEAAIDGDGRWFGAMEDAAEAPATTVAASGEAYSTTNVQEAGIDEPDLVKSDGERIFAIAGGYLHIVETRDGDPRLAGSLSLDGSWAQDMLLAGDRVVLLSHASRWDPIPFSDSIWPGEPGWYGGDVSVLTEIDVSDPDDMRISRVLHVDGTYLSARMSDGIARVVVRAHPTGLDFTTPEEGGLRGRQDALEENRRVIEESDADDWLPYFVLEDRTRGVPRIDEGRLVQCADMARPDEFSGFSTLALVTLDLTRGLDDFLTTGLVANGETIYASSDALYVATQRWIEPGDDGIAPEEMEGAVTEIHKFATDGAFTGYRATGTVDGYLLSQWAMSEHDGFLRVASTTAPAWWGPDQAAESMVTVLEEHGGELVRVGSVDGLGKGERIYTVRFIEDVGYVVTFRQVDPLYTIDLSDPTDPRVRGELKILGYSAYLHPLGDNLLLGIGQDATEQGRTLGTQISVFDVSDLDDPQRLSKRTLENSGSDVEYDHRAFLHWPETGLTVIPVNRWWWDDVKDTDEFFAGAIAFTVDRTDGIELAGRVTHDADGNGWADPIRRSLVAGDLLYTVSDRGILASDLDTLDEEAWLPFHG